MKNILFLYNSIIAHRGIYDNKTIFENSMLAFKKALEYNLPIELDIHLLKDNTIVVFHDNNLKRITGIDKEISSCNYEELNQIFLKNTYFKVPTLLDVLKLINGTVFLNIEIKNDRKYKKMCKELIKILDSYQGKFVIKSFYPKYIRWFSKNKSQYIRGILLGDKTYNKYKNIVIKLLEIYCKPDFYAVNQNIVKEKEIQNIRKKNKPILTWTIKSFEEVNDIRKYSDGIVFDFINYSNITYEEFIKKKKKI